MPCCRQRQSTGSAGGGVGQQFAAGREGGGAGVGVGGGGGGGGGLEGGGVGKGPGGHLQPVGKVPTEPAGHTHDGMLPVYGGGQVPASAWGVGTAVSGGAGSAAFWA